MIKIFEEFLHKEFKPKFPVGSYVKFTNFIHEGRIFEVKGITSNGIFNAPNTFNYDLVLVYTTKFDKVGLELKGILESVLDKVEDWEISAKKYNL